MTEGDISKVAPRKRENCILESCAAKTSKLHATIEVAVYSFSQRDFFENAVYLFSWHDFPYCKLRVFAVLLSKMPFTRFRSATFEIVIYSFSWRYFRSCSLLIFVGRLAILQLIRFRGANFEIEVYSLSLPKSFPIDRTL